jgi:class 3 adenylate cyclase
VGVTEAMQELPNGTVTLLFTDVEGSTRLLQRLGDRYGTALDDERRLLRDAVAAQGGREIDCRGDEFFGAFPRARAAVAAAVAAQRALAQHAWPGGVVLKVRMGLHTGEPALRDDGYLGLDVHRAARISAAAHGGQVLVSQVTREILLDEDVSVRDLGEWQLKDLPRPERLFQIVIDDLDAQFPPPKVASAAPAAGRERELAAAVLATPRRLFERIRPRPRGLADLGWDVRAALAAAPTEMHEPLSRLARELFDAASVAAEADHALAAVDRKALVRRLAENRSLSVLSKAAGREAESMQERLDALDDLAEGRRALDAVAEEVRSRPVPRLSRLQTDAIRDRLRLATEALDAALENARRRLDFVSARLRRTRHSGVYRMGEQFVVPYFDEVGIERREAFDSLPDAIAFARGRRIAARGEPGDREAARLRGEYLDSFAPNRGQEFGILPPRSEHSDRD